MAPIILITPVHLFKVRNSNEPGLQPTADIPAAYTVPTLSANELFALDLHIPGKTLQASQELRTLYEECMLRLFPKKEKDSVIE